MDVALSTKSQPPRFRTYDQFRRWLAASNCRKCGLCRGRTNIVVDRGNASAKIMMIGEAPGRNEDLQGRAFVGQAGRLLDQLMMEIDLDTNRDVLITNIAKCRPPNNRPPTCEEAQMCLPYLHQQIDLVRPKCLVLLGATALRHLSAKAGFSQMKNEVGKFFELTELRGVPAMVLYHPAALLYNRRLIPVMKNHLNVLKKFLKAETTPR